MSTATNLIFLIKSATGTTAGGCSLIKVEPEDSVTVTVAEDSANASEIDQEHGEDDLEDTEQLLNDADESRSE